MKSTKKKGIYERSVKRLLDIIGSCALLIVLSPVFLILTLMVRSKLGSPVLFKQARPGLNEKIFYMKKFRSMTNETDEDGKLLPDDRRLTKFGKILRKTSLDELPEIVNIFKGDMSFVGPRPLSIYYLPHYSDEARKRHEVRPGLTGLAQINGRNTIGWDDRFAYDIKYAEHVSFINDLKILFGTVAKVAKGSGIAVRGTAKIRDFGPYKIISEEGKTAKVKYDMTYPEIGSFFWLEQGYEPMPAKKDFSWLPEMNDSAFTFSGRAAIDTVVKDIIRQDGMFKVYVPSYCCVSMLQSFIDHDIPYEFYDVNLGSKGFEYGTGNIKEGDVVLIMNYFGLDTQKVHDEIKRLNDRGVIIIEDITHSLLCETPAAPESDYVVASLRKWFAVPAGGWCGSAYGDFHETPNMDSNHAVDGKVQGMELKAAYIRGGITDKEEFLALQAKFDNDLIHVDRMLKIDDISYGVIAAENIERIKKRRRDNAEFLCNGLSDIYGEVMTFMVPDVSVDTPLFFPVFLKHEDRESLRKSLIEAGIYTPVHWPEVCGAKPGIRENELSLICDQRYTLKDMKAIVDAIHEWYRGRYGS